MESPTNSDEMTMSSRRLLHTRKNTYYFLFVILIVLWCMMYMIGNSSHPLDDVAYYAAHVDTVMAHAWRKIRSTLKISSPEVLFMEQETELQKSRRAALDAACNKYFARSSKYSPFMSLPEKSFVIEEYRLLYTPTAKIATTSWDRVMLVLSHLANDTSRYSQSETIDMAKRHVSRLTAYMVQDRLYIWENFIKFMFTRHPFSRLLSAYTCKVGPRATEEHLKRGHFNRLREKIIKRYPSTNGIPDFRSFVQYIVDNDYFEDAHWKENYKIVSPCDVHYDIIGRFETLENDARFILQSVGADKIVQFPTSEGSTPTNSSHKDVLIKHFQTLSIELIEKLYQRYQLDFLLFGYTFEITIDGYYLQFP